MDTFELGGRVYKKLVRPAMHLPRGRTGLIAIPMITAQQIAAVD